MNVITESLDLDVTRRSNIKIIHIKQCDKNSRRVRTSIYVEGVKQTISESGNTALINIRRPDAETGSYAATINNDGTVTATIPYFAGEIPGGVSASISILEGTEIKLTTESFIIQVDRSDNSSGDISEDTDTDILLDLIAKTNAALDRADEFVDNTAENAERAETAAETAEHIADIVDVHKDGYYPSMTVGTSEQLIGEATTSDNTPYLFRKSAGSGLESNTLIGASVAWNQKERLLASTYWEARGDTSSGSFDDGVATITASTSFASLRMKLNYYVTWYENHVYLEIVDLKSDVESKRVRRFIPLSNRNYDYGTIYTPSSTWERFTSMFKITETTSKQGGFEVLNSVADDVIYFRNVQHFDLTQMFGTDIADYIYSLEQANAGDGVAYFKSLFPKDYYEYNAGELISVKPTAHVMRDADENIIGNYTLGSDELRGIPQLTNGKLSYNGDRKTANGLIARKYGIVDLGTLNYMVTGTADSSIKRMRSVNVLTNAKKPSSAGTVANIICSKYLAVSDSQTAGTGSAALTVGIAIDADGYIRIYDTNYNQESSSATAFKASLSGQYLVYEAAAPTTEQGTAYSPYQRVSADGTEEFVDERDVPVPVGHETQYYENLQPKLLNAPTIERYGVLFTDGTNPGTRLFSAKGKTAEPSTDEVFGRNDFDSIMPWAGMRRCCGFWEGNHFVVNAYKGDPGYASDGSNGEVWVEVPKFYYKWSTDGDSEQYDVSMYQYVGYRCSDIHVDEDGHEYPYAYIPAYPMATIDNLPTSRSGVYPGVYSLNSAMTNARKAGTDFTCTTAAERRMLEILFIVEFATRNSQSIMMGSSLLPYNASHVATVAENNTNRIIIAESYADQFVVGQTIGIGTSIGGNQIATNRMVTAKNDYDSSSKAIVFDGDPVNIAVGNVAYSLAYINGSCNEVLGSSGSPVSNTNGKYNCVYRGVEKPYGDSFEWISDVLIQRLGAGTTEDPYKYTPCFLRDARKYSNGSVTSDYTHLNYNISVSDGYVKTKGTDSRYPFINLPTAIGASNATYYSDYYWYPRSVVTAACVGGNWSDGVRDGLSSWYCFSAPSNSSVACRARLSHRRHCGG